MQRKSDQIYKEKYALDSEHELKEVRAKLQIAVWMGMISRSEFSALEERRKQNMWKKKMNCSGYRMEQKKELEVDTYGKNCCDRRRRYCFYDKEMACLRIG